MMQRMKSVAMSHSSTNGISSPSSKDLLSSSAPSVKSPLSRMASSATTNAGGSGTDDGDAETDDNPTPTPGTPGQTAGEWTAPPRGSSLKAQEMRSVGATSQPARDGAKDGQGQSSRTATPVGA